MEQNNTKKEHEEILVKKKKNPIFFIILIIVVIIAGFFGFRKFQFSQLHEETDDAQIAADISPVISKVSGFVSEVKVKDNQFVKKGDTIIILDSRDQLMSISQAEAALGTAENNLASAKAGSDAAASTIKNSEAAEKTASAQIEAAKINVWRTELDMKRYSELIKDHSITQQQYEQALASYKIAQKNLQVLIDQKKQANVQTGVVASQSYATHQSVGVANASIKQRKVDVENAKLNLSYTIIVAKESGYVSKIPIVIGQYIQSGSQLFSIVLNNNKWVVANYKETQIEKMVEGQKVDIKIDAYPDETFKGTISSFSPATGSAFALLPPDNASGNFVKVVQRLPIKITFDNLNEDIMKKLRVGMNVQTTVSLKN